jgi:hypothetical protein
MDYAKVTHEIHPHSTMQRVFEINAYTAPAQVIGETSKHHTRKIYITRLLHKMKHRSQSDQQENSRGFDQGDHKDILVRLTVSQAGDRK